MPGSSPAGPENFPPRHRWRAAPPPPQPPPRPGQRRGSSPRQPSQADHGGECGDPLNPRRLHCQPVAHLPRDHRHRHPGRRRGGDHGPARLPGQRRLVEPPLPRDDQVRTGQRPVQPRQPAQFRRPRSKSCAPGGRQPVTSPARGPGPRRGRIPAEHPGEPAQPCLQPRDLHSVGTLLRPENRRRPSRPQQWRSHIGQASHSTSRRSPQPAQVHPGKCGQRPAARRKRLPGGVEEPGPQRGQCSGPPVGGRRTTEPDQDPSHPGIQCPAQQLTEPGRLGPHRIRPCQQRQPTGPRQFHDGRAGLQPARPRSPPPGQFQPASGHRGTARASNNGAVPAGAGHRGRQHVQGSLAAVRQRQPGHLVSRPHTEPPLGQRGRGRGGPEAALERVGRDQHPHGGRPGPNSPRP